MRMNVVSVHTKTYKKMFYIELYVMKRMYDFYENHVDLQPPDPNQRLLTSNLPFPLSKRVTRDKKSYRTTLIGVRGHARKIYFGIR